jgi:uncharacterized membrane-anchored protein
VRIPENYATKVPAVTIGFWVIKIPRPLGRDRRRHRMTWNLGYLVGTGFFLSALVALVAIQIAAKKFHPFLYWSVIVASTTAGTTMADFATRFMGIGYTGGSLILCACLMAVLGLWYWSAGSISVDTVNTPKVEAFYWAAITFSQTLGTALGDWMADVRSRLCRRSARLRGRASLARCCLPLDRHLSGFLVLGRLHSHSTLGRYSWRLP